MSKCCFHPSSKKILSVVGEGYYRDTQLAKMQRVSDGGVLIPKWGIYDITPHPRLRKDLGSKISKVARATRGTSVK